MTLLDSTARLMPVSAQKRVSVCACACACACACVRVHVRVRVCVGEGGGGVEEKGGGDVLSAGEHDDLLGILLHDHAPEVGGSLLQRSLGCDEVPLVPLAGLLIPGLHQRCIDVVLGVQQDPVVICTGHQHPSSQSGRSDRT